MSKQKFTPLELAEIEKAVRKSSIPYEYRTKDYPLEVLRSKFGDEDNPDASLFVPAYQRKFVWTPEQQTRFIESVLLGVPLTPFLVSEDANARLEIIDGSQRIRTLIAFRDDLLSLRTLNKLTRLKGLKYSELPKRLQNMIDNRDFKVIVVSDKATLDIRQDIFDRINTSSAPLTDSEVRKGAYSGDFYNLIAELCKDPLFKKLCPVSDGKGNRGEREELVLRFFAYSDRYLDFRHDVAAFLDSYLDDMNRSKFDRKARTEQFHKMLKFVKGHFPNGFAKEAGAKTTPRVRFEAIAVGVHLALLQKPTLIPASMDWLKSKEFSNVTTSDGSNSRSRLTQRIHFVRNSLLGLPIEVAKDA